MSRRYPDGANPSVAPTRNEPARARGPHLGPFRITPLRLTLVIALVGGIGFLLYSTFARDQLQVPMMATGFAICGLVFAAVAVLAVVGVVQAGRDGRDGRAVLSAVVGGLVAVGALMFLSAAVIMGMIWIGTRTT